MIFCCVALLWGAIHAVACTSVIVSGRVTPYGYLVRTNHGMSGDRTLDQGIERFMAISDYMSRAGFELKKQLFPLERGNGRDYINLARLINRAGTGILQQTEPIETAIFQRAAAVLETVRQRGQAGHETTDFYQWVDQYVREQYEQRLGIILNR